MGVLAGRLTPSAGSARVPEVVMLVTEHEVTGLAPIETLLTSGTRHRPALARAVASAPDLLLVDEPNAPSPGSRDRAGALRRRCLNLDARTVSRTRCQFRVRRALVWKTVLSGHPSTNGFETDLGARVRTLRRERGLTLKGLGRLAGLSHPFLSQVERGLARPSVSSVERIAAALDVSVARLWSPLRQGDAVQVIRRDDGQPDEHGVRALPGEPGAPVLREWAGRGRRWPDEYDVQSGEVAVYVARGALEVDLDGEIHTLAEGDTLRFDGTIPHRLRRSGGTSTRALIIAAS